MTDTEDMDTAEVSPPPLPKYCFQAGPRQTEPAWCVASNIDYVTLCTEVDQVNDSWGTNMSWLESWPEKEGSTSRESVKFDVDIKQKRATFGSNLSTTSKKLTLEAHNIRYCYLLNDKSPLATVGDGESASDTPVKDQHVLCVSYWAPDYTGSVRTLLLTAEEEMTSVKVMNLIRKVIGPGLRLERFVPYMMGPLTYHLGPGDLIKVDDVPDKDYEPVVVTVDEECLAFSKGPAMRSGEWTTLQFTTVQKEEAIERIYAHTVITLVEFETSKGKYLFKKYNHERTYKEFAFIVQGRIKAKPGDMFDFNHPETYANYTPVDPPDLYAEDLPLYVPLGFNKETKEKPEPEAMGQSLFDNPTADVRDREGWAGPSETPVTQHRPDGNGAQAMASGVSDEDVNQANMDTLVVSMTSSTSSLEGISEDLQIMWFTLEADIDKLLSDGLVPEVDVDSGGLDENSHDHLHRALKAVQDALFAHSVDKAVAHIRGIKKTFSKCRYEMVRNWLDHNDEKELLKQVYFTGSR